MKYNLKNIILNIECNSRIVINEDKSKVSIAYKIPYCLEEEYIILKKGRINYNEMISLLRNCVSDFKSENVTLELLENLNNEILDKVCKNSLKIY